MYIIDISYTAPLNHIDAALSDHQEWLDTQYAAGRFLASGRQEPRTGGIIIAVDQSREEIKAFVATDPFAQRGLARHRLIEFHPSRMLPADSWPIA
jgi:uncharacterized protein YciI